MKIILRKHRDVIFEIKLGQQRNYTVESNGSDFYNADEKKLVPGKSARCVSFNDGDRLHLWIARDFNGALLLKSGGKLVLKIEPAKLDVRQYNSDPKTKPDPIIVAFGADSHSSSRAVQNKNTLKFNTSQSVRHSMDVRPIAAPVEEDCALVCVVDGDVKGIPSDVWNALKGGGGQSGWADIDPNNIATRNWLLGQLSGAGAYVGDNWEWLRASIDGKRHDGLKLVKAKIHYVKGKAKFYFSGYSKHNKVFGPGGFGSGHDRIMSIFGGAGKAGSTLKSTVNGVAGTFKGNALVSFIFGSAAALAEWQGDVSKDGYDLAASLLTTVIKSLFSAAVTVLIVTCLVLLVMFFLGTSLSVIAVGAITIGVGVAVNYGVDALDKKLGRMVVGESHQDGLSAVLAERMRQSVQYHWDYLRKKLLWSEEEVVL
ncbi:hypothetical protein ACHAC9_08870 [Massilia sp. CMS3.1]|uniref:hypothetical protein n=1 Tax=Massilia sp. CMS3.1 TaxID=3373083 RepID=UPI003EE7090F